MEASYKVVGVIPARYQSTRLPQKLLRNLVGKPLLQWTWERAKSCHLLDKLVIACDHPKIEETAKNFGAQVVLTSKEHISGTDRVAEAVTSIDVKIIINIQADEPLIHSSVIDSLAQEMLDNPNLVMATAKTKIKNEGEINSPHVVKVVCDRDNFALYFSRFPIPYFRDKDKLPASSKEEAKDFLAGPPYYKHLGIYAYTKDFLYTFKNLSSSYLEEAEKLEQLRAVEAGFKIKVIETQFDSWGVDTEEDFAKVEEILKERKA